MTAAPDGPWIGASVPRREDERLLAGRGRFLADLAAPSTLHAAFLRSTQPHAHIVSVDASAARALPGVALAVTGDDLRGTVAPLPVIHEPDPAFSAATSFTATDPRLACLAVDRVLYVGQPVAVVVAASRRVAEDALELIRVVYEALPAVADAPSALLDDAPVLHPHLPSNEAASIAWSAGAVDAALESAAVTVTETYRMGRHGAVPLECRGVLAAIDERRRRVEVWTSTQIPHLVRRGICAATGWSLDDVRVAAPDVGGGFGTKANIYAEEVVIPVLARMLGRDVIWVEDRLEHLVAAAQGRDQLHATRLSVDTDGAILAWEDDFLVDVGAASLWTAGIVANTAIHLMGPYRIPAFRVTGRAAYTNRAIVAQYRGAGRPEACFALERSLDDAAARLGISPVEIRRRNVLTASDLPYPRPIPYRDGVPIEYDGGDYLACLEACLEMLPDEEVARVRAEHPDLAVGRGVALYIEATGRGPYECARLTLLPGGGFEVGAGSASAGQGHETTLAQVAADALAVNPAAVRIVGGDTDAVHDGIGTFASRSAIMAGNAVHLAAERLVARAREAAGGRAFSWPELAAALRLPGSPSGPLLEEVVRYEAPTVTWTAGAHAALVGVDRETGLTRVLRYAVAHEGGVEINPMVVDGQIAGGVAQGIGGALLETFAYGEDGQPQTGSFADYLLPTSDDVPAVAVRHLEVETSANPLGVRGAGESGTIAAYPAIAAAIDAALGAGAPHVTAMPVDPAWIAEAADRALEKTVA